MDRKFRAMITNNFAPGIAVIFLLLISVCSLTACSESDPAEISEVDEITDRTQLRAVTQGKTGGNEESSTRGSEENMEFFNTATEYKDLAYDTLSESQKLDLYLPETGEGPFPLIVFIHGGGWYSCDKADGQEAAWVELRKQGYAVASINYRLSGEAAHPAGLIDCKIAIRFLRANAEQYQLDPERVAVSGGSSGGHYALMVALTPGNPEFEDLSRGYPEENTDVCCAVGWYPATDLSAIMRAVQTGEYTGFGAEYAWANIERYIGKTIEDVNDESLSLASPVHYISEDMPPILLQHGDVDKLCPVSQSWEFYHETVSAVDEDRVTIEILNDADHADHAFETAENMKTVSAFLDQYLK